MYVRGIATFLKPPTTQHIMHKYGCSLDRVVLYIAENQFEGVSKNVLTLFSCHQPPFQSAEGQRFIPKLKIFG